MIYQITTTENQKDEPNNEVSTIDLLECESILKEKYDINQTTPLIIFKIDYKTNDTKIPIIGYEIYNPKNMSKLDLTHCNNSILVKVPASVDEDKLFLNNPNSEFYKDSCFSYTTDNGTDITIDDRKQEFIDKNLSLCELNCSYINYDIETKKSYCNCLIKNRMDLISEIVNNSNKLAINFTTESDDSSLLNTMKCMNELLSKDGLKYNIASYIMIFIFFYFLLSILFFIKCGYSNIEELIENIIDILKNNKQTIYQKTNNRNKKPKKKLKKNSILNYKYPPKRNTKFNPINHLNLDKNKNIELIKRHRSHSLRENKSISKKTNKNVKIIKRKSEISLDKNIVEDKNIKIEFNIFEFNSLSYKDSIIYDKRTFFEYYISLIKTKHPLLFGFCPIKDYNLMMIKICLFLIFFTSIYVINFLFFDKKTIHKIYMDEGHYDFIYFIPKILISFLSSNFIYIIIRYIFLSERNLLKIRRQNSVDDAQKIAEKEKRNLIIKYIVFFIVGILLFIFFWMQLSSFGAVYQNTQIIVFQNTLICFAISLIYPFFINIFPGIFRISSLNSYNKDKNCLYNFSKILQML